MKGGEMSSPRYAGWLSLVFSSILALPVGLRAADDALAVTMHRIDLILSQVAKVDSTEAPGSDDLSSEDGASDEGPQEARTFVAGSDGKIEAVHQVETEVHAGFLACKDGKAVERLLAWSVALPHRMETVLGPFDYEPFLEILQKDALARHLQLSQAGRLKAIQGIEDRARRIRGGFAARERYVKEMMGRHLHGELADGQRLMTILDRERGKLKSRFGAWGAHLEAIEGKLGKKENAVYAREEKRYDRLKRYEGSLEDSFTTYQAHWTEEVHAHHLEGAAAMLGRFADEDADGNMFHPASLRIEESRGFTQAIVINMIWPGRRARRHLELRHPDTGEGTGKVKDLSLRRHGKVTLQLGFSLKDVEWDRYPESQTFLAGLGFAIGRKGTLCAGWARSLDDDAPRGFYMGVSISAQRLLSMTR